MADSTLFIAMAIYSFHLPLFVVGHTQVLIDMDREDEQSGRMDEIAAHLDGLDKNEIGFSAPGCPYTLYEQ